MMELSELREKLQNCPNLPSSPQVANQLIELMETASPDVEEIVKILARDSALTAKILQLANSSFFPYKHKVTTILKASILIGYNGILATALSFTLVQHLRKEGTDGLDLELFWRRSLLTASACRAIGEVCLPKDVEELFLVGLIQDIGMLGLDRLMPELYVCEGLNQLAHSKVVEHERQAIGADHALVGSWLLTDWSFPSKLCTAVQLSDDPDPSPAADGAERFNNCVKFGVTLTELIMTNASEETLLELVDVAEARLGLDPFAFATILAKVKNIVRETEVLFDMNSQSEGKVLHLIEQAKTLLTKRHAQLATQLDALFLQGVQPEAV